MVSAGRVLIMPKGAWNTTDTYSMLDLVSYNGSSYVAKQSVPANTLPTNTTYWQISAYGGDASNLAGNFATLETTDYASQDYDVHDFLVTKDSVFCEVTAHISSSDEIIVDTNVEATNVGKLIQAVIARMNSLDAENVKLKGKTAITTQTDLDDLTTIGNYYKNSTSVYVTNAPTGINEEITAVFRLTVENGSDNTDTLIQTIVQDNGNTYKRSYDGTNWSSWDQVVLKSALDTALSAKANTADLGTAATKDTTSSITQNSTDPIESGAVFTGQAAKVDKTDIAPVEASSTATAEHDTGKQFYYDGVLREATADIDIGDTITPGTNCKAADKVVDQLAALAAENQTLTKYANAQSNPNLLDNPWFTVNQRGQSSYTTTSNMAYGMDRWLLGVNDVVNVTDDGISVPSEENIYQRISATIPSWLIGKVVTLSGMFSDGTLYSTNGVITNENKTFLSLSNDDIYLALGKDAYFFYVALTIKSTTKTLRAVKLELGEVSTLAQDTAPNYATELLKCQRYFQALAENTDTNYGVGMGQARTTTKAEIHVPLACQMRREPTITFSGGIKLRNAENVISVTNISVECDGRNEILLAMAATGLTAGAAYSCFAYHDGVLELSADL